MLAELLVYFCGMQTKLLLGLIMLAFTYSCQSEYDRQLQSAKTQLEVFDKSKMEFVQEEFRQQEVKKLQNKILFCAEMSGNKRLFLKELNLEEIN